MIEERTWEEFSDNGLLFINQILNIFGWSIVLEYDKTARKVIKAYPARVDFRGFDKKDLSECYKNLSRYMVDNAHELFLEALNQ